MKLLSAKLKRAGHITNEHGEKQTSKIQAKEDLSNIFQLLPDQSVMGRDPGIRRSGSRSGLVGTCRDLG